jgi:hypothetical protein
MLMTPVPSRIQVWPRYVTSARWEGGKAAPSATDEDHDRAVGFLDRDRMAQAVVVGHARRRHHLGGVLAGAKRYGNTDQRSRQAEGAPGIGGLR